MKKAIAREVSALAFALDPAESITIKQEPTSDDPRAKSGDFRGIDPDEKTAKGGKSGDQHLAHERQDELEGFQHILITLYQLVKHSFVV